MYKIIIALIKVKILLLLHLQRDQYMRNSQLIIEHTKIYFFNNQFNHYAEEC
jgi:hypothetical protein